MGDSASLIAGVDASPSLGQGSSRQHQLHPAPVTLGYAAVCQSAAGKRVLCFKNLGAQLASDMIPLRYSSKRNNWALAGQSGAAHQQTHATQNGNHDWGL